MNTSTPLQRLHRPALARGVGLAAALALAAPVVLAQGTGTPAASGSTAPAVLGPVGAVDATTLNGRITAIDKSRRIVSVQGDKGRSITLHIGPNVANFDNLKVGDQVAARYTEAVALAIAKGNSSDIRTKVEADAARMAPPGGKPGVSAMERTTVVANVLDVDRQHGRVTLKGIGSSPVTMRVRDSQTLSQLKPDDQVVISYEQAAAISIAPGSEDVKSATAAGADEKSQAAPKR
jgi:hypothetical protein